MANKLKTWHIILILIAAVLAIKYFTPSTMSVGQLQSVVGEDLGCHPQPDPGAFGVFDVPGTLGTKSFFCDASPKPALLNIYSCNSDESVPGACDNGRTRLSGDYEFLIKDEPVTVGGFDSGKSYYYECYGGCNIPSSCQAGTSVCVDANHFEKCIAAFTGNAWSEEAYACGSGEFCNPDLSTTNRPCSSNAECIPSYRTGEDLSGRCVVWDAHGCDNADELAVKQIELCETTIIPDIPPIGENESGSTTTPSGGTKTDCLAGQVKTSTGCTTIKIGSGSVVIQALDVLNDFEGDSDKVNPGGVVYVQLDVINQGTSDAAGTTMEVAVYPKSVVNKLFPSLGFSVLGRAGITEVPTCKGEPFVTAVKIDSLPAKGTARWIIPVKAPKSGDVFATTGLGDAYAGDGQYVVVAGMYKECGTGYDINGDGKIGEGEFDYSYITETKDSLTTHKKLYGDSCIVILGVGEDECQSSSTGAKDVTGVCKEPISIAAFNEANIGDYFAGIFGGSKPDCSIPLTKQEVIDLKETSDAQAKNSIKQALCMKDDNCAGLEGYTVSCKSIAGIKSKTGITINTMPWYDDVYTTFFGSSYDSGICYADKVETAGFDFGKWFSDNKTVVIIGVVVVLLIIAVSVSKGRRMY